MLGNVWYAPLTEAEWLASDDPGRMLEWLTRYGRASERKLRLFACACLRRIWDRLDDALSRRAVEVAEVIVDCVPAERLPASLDKMYRSASRGRSQAVIPSGPAWAVLSPGAAQAACYTDYHVAVRVAGGVIHRRCVRDHSGAPRRSEPVYADPHAFAVERAAHALLLRDIVGNPFRPRNIAPKWQTAAVVGLAEQIHQDETPQRLTELADVLEVVGCDAEILAHLRGPGPHVRGYWVVDLLLDKN
jgi:hypothetical protein